MENKYLEIDLSKVNLKKFLQTLLRYVSFATGFHTVTYKNITYKEVENVYVSNNDFEENDQLHISEDVYTPTIYPHNDNAVIYNLSYDNSAMSNYDEDDMPESIDEINRYIQKYGFKSVKFINFSSIFFINKRGVNHDYRGSNFCKLYLSFYSVFELKNEDSVTFYDIANAFYRIKSHKWDSHYEMYIDCEVFVTNLIENDKTTSNIVVIMDYDHGS